MPPLSFLDRLRAAWPVDAWQVPSLVAVSGGPDSVALLHGLTELRPATAAPLTVVHFNHRLRGEESQADARLVGQLAERLGLDLKLGQAPRHDASISPAPSEDQLRQARYAFFRSAARATGARYLAMAHTANDQAETVLQRIARGTGLSGLSGIPRTRPLSEWTTIIRPLLEIDRDTIEDYLRTAGIDFRIDSSNTSLHYARNRIRHQLLPWLQQHLNPQAIDALGNLAFLARQAQAIVQQRVQQAWDQVVMQHTPHSVTLRRPSDAQVDDFLLTELLVSIWNRQSWPLGEMGRRRWEQVCQAIHSPDAPIRDFPGGIHVHWHPDRVVLRQDTRREPNA